MKNQQSVLLFLFINILISQFVFAQYKGHGADSVSADTLKKYVAPSLDAVMSNKLKKMLDVSSPGMGMLSPDKKTLFFSWRVTGISHIWKIDGPQKFPVQLTSGTDAVTLQDVAPNGKFLIISKDTNGQENPGLFKLDLATGAITELYKKEKAQVTYSFITSDSKYVYYSSNDQKPDSYNIYRLNLETLEKQMIYEGQGVWYIADHKKNGQRLLLVNVTGSRTSEYFDYDSATKNMKPVIGQKVKDEYEVEYSHHEDEYIVLTPKENFKKLYRLNPKKSEDLIPLVKGVLNYDVESFSIDEKRKRIVYNINREGYTELRALSAKTYQPIQIPSFKNAIHVFSGTTTRDAEVTMLAVVNSQSPRTSYSFNWTTQKMTQWVLPSAPEVNLKTFAVSELMNYETRDGVKIPMFVRFPNGCKETKKCPVVIHFHGGPEGQSQPGFSPTLQAFVDEGFIFIEPNVRGSEGYGKAWLESDNGPLREKVITDIEDASIWIRKNWFKDMGDQAPKIGVMGWSYGGYSTLMAMSKFAGSYEAGVALVGMSDLVSFLNNTAPYRRTLRITEYGDPVKDKESLMRLSPVTYVNQVRAPLMIIQGANDPRVPVGEALQIHETLKRKNIKSELIIFADEGHGSSKKENQILEIGHMIEFFKKYLKK